MRLQALFLHALAPALVLAQVELPWETVPADSLRAFQARMLAQPIRLQAPAPLNEYELVWMEHDNGYFVATIPGDTATTLFSMLLPERQMSLGHMEGPTYYGEHYAVLVRDRPVSMSDITRWFFERR